MAGSLKHLAAVYRHYGSEVHSRDEVSYDDSLPSTGSLAVAWDTNFGPMMVKSENSKSRIEPWPIPKQVILRHEGR